MIEKVGNIFDQTDASAICFTSNGVVKNDGALVMGAGVAKAFRERFKGLDIAAGFIVAREGNKCQIIESHRYYLDPVLSIVAFPTKHHWRDPSDPKLIEKSAKELVVLADQCGWQKIYLPRPGCANGGLNWDSQVKPLIAPLLDDRFTILTLR